MPRYHLNVIDESTFLDRDGAEFSDPQAAQIAAIAYAGEFIADRAKRANVGTHWRMEVTDALGLILFRLDFHITPSPAMRTITAQ
ncbi:hypothetical protein HCU64_22905 [Methylobacterium sp. C25]|uniref:DUF6894 family protein n=1 Tax=Methylobacterium sp. C25 TaxID=2721622 RepID=UPI001F1D2197|nr:hypothetical protein [Methylobacterium sp. C25]MCE4226596.1 hypothetical protein [Methylobacterium sp. C25]